METNAINLHNVLLVRACFKATPTSNGGWENDCLSGNIASLNTIQILLTRKKGRLYIGRQLIVYVTNPYEGPNTVLDHVQVSF